MPIRPIDIRRKEFRNGFRGYDANQVDDFLDTVADEFERTYNENQRMREEVSGLRERLQQFEDLEGSIRAALVHAEQAANDLRRSANQEAADIRQGAQREADFTVRDAQNRSHQMLADSASRIERVQDSYEALQEAKRSFGNDFRHLLKTYMDMMENMELSSARDIESALRDRLDTESIAVVREAAATEREDPETPEPEQPAFGTVAAEEPVVADVDDPGATARIVPEEPVEPEAPEAEADEPETAEPETTDAGAGQAPITLTTDETRADEQDTQILRPEEPTSSPGPLSDDPVYEPIPEEPAVDEQAEAASAGDEAPASEPETTEPEVEPSTAQGGSNGGAAVDGPRTDPDAAGEVEREEPALAEESRSQEFFDRENTGREGGDSRISRASRFLRRRE